IEPLVPLPIKRKCLAALHTAEFRRFPPLSPYGVFHLGNCKPSLGDITQRMRRESYGFHLEVNDTQYNRRDSLQNGHNDRQKAFKCLIADSTIASQTVGRS